MRTKTPLRCAAVAASFALLVAACGGGSGGGSGDSGAGAAGGSFTTDLREPSFLAPAQNCYESECDDVLKVVDDPVVSVDLDSGDLVYDGLAKSITSDDNTVWTVKLNSGRTFQNGEPVTADSFINAWNYSANPKNAMATAGFMSHIKGYGKGEELSGLKKINDTTFQVTLSGPFSQFAQEMSYGNAFQPMADACMQDLKACNEKPIGTGPYQMKGPWRHDQGITVTKWDGYKGKQAAMADQIDYKISTDTIASFREFQSGQIDVLGSSTGTGLDPTVYDEAKAQYPDKLIEEQSSTLTYMGFPTKTKPFDNAKYRQAVSMAINRQQIIDKVLSGTQTASTDIVVPALPGARDDACQFCTYDPAKAKQLFKEAGGKPGQTVDLWFNAGSGHEKWVEAIGNQLKQNLGINFRMQGKEWAQFLQILDAGNFTGPFRLGWGMDYPSPENYVRPIVGTGGDSNYSDYSNPQVDKYLVQGDRANSLQAGIKYYQKADDIALQDLPILPLWSGKTSVLSSDRVSNVTYNIADDVPLNEVTVN